MAIIGSLDPCNVLNRRISDLGLTLKFLADFCLMSQPYLYSVLITGRITLKRDLELNLHQSLDEIERLQKLLGPSVTSVLKFNGNALAYRGLLNKLEVGDLRINIEEKFPPTEILELKLAPSVSNDNPLAAAIQEK